MSLIMIAYAYLKDDGRWLWTTNIDRVEEWEAEGRTICTRRVWMGRGGEAWFKPGDKWTPLRKEKVR